MTVNDFIKKLESVDKDSVMIYLNTDGGWTNIELGTIDGGCVVIKPSENIEFN